MPGSQNINDISNMTDREQKRSAWNTVDTQQEFLFDYHKITSKDQKMPAKDQIPEKQQKRPTWPAYFAEEDSSTHKLLQDI